MSFSGLWKYGWPKWTLLMRVHCEDMVSHLKSKFPKARVDEQGWTEKIKFWRKRRSCELTNWALMTWNGENKSWREGTLSSRPSERERSSFKTRRFSAKMPLFYFCFFANLWGSWRLLKVPQLVQECPWKGFDTVYLLCGLSSWYYCSENFLIMCGTPSFIFDSS